MVNANPSEWAKLLLSEWTKLLHPRYYLAVAITTGLLLFLPEAVVSQIGLQGFRSGAARPWLGLLFVLSVALLLTHGLVAISNWGRQRWRTSRITKQRHRWLATLTKDEKDLLRWYIEQGKKTAETQINSGVVTGLASKGIVYIASDTAYQFTVGFWVGQVNISDWAWDYLRANRKLLEPDPHESSAGEPPPS